MDRGFFLKISVVIGIIISLTGCNTVTGTIEGGALGVVKDVKTTYH